MTQPHTAHEFSRLLSQTPDGIGLYGCAFRANGTVIGCSETEVRRVSAPSPHAIKRATAKAAAAKRKTRGGS